MKLALLRRLKDLLSETRTLSFTFGDASFFAANYANFVREGYQKNPIVYGAMEYICKSVSALKWSVFNGDEDNKTRERIPKHPLVDLMRRPSPKISKADFFRRLTIHEYLEGDAFIFINAPGGPKAKPVELNILRPDRVQIRNGKFFYQQDNGVEREFQFEDIVRIMLYNPINEMDGFAPLQAGSRSVDVNNAGRQWNLSVLKNSIKLGTWFETTGDLGDRTGALEAKIREKFSGDGNQGKAMILTGGLTVKEGSFSPKDMDWKSSSGQSALEILQVMNFPPELLGIAENRTFSNYKEARKSFFSETVIPFAKHIRDGLNIQLVEPRFGKDVFLDIDTDAIDALQEDKNEKEGRIVKKYQAGIITLTEARNEIGYEELQPGQMEDLYTGPMGSFGSGLDSTVPAKSVKSISPEQKRRRRNRYEIVEGYRKQFEAHFTARVREQFMSERPRVRTMIKGSDTTTAGVKTTEIIREAFVPEWIKMLAEFYMRVCSTIGDREMDNVLDLKKSAKAKPKFDPFSQAVQTRVRFQVGTQVRNIAKTTERLIKKRIQDGIEEGLSIDAIADSMDQLYEVSMIPNRAVTIARTETISTTNFAGQEVARQSGLTLKKIWISTLDGKTRGSEEGDEFDHVDMDSQPPIEISQPYNVGGEKMMYPGDSSLGASPGNFINCRCAEAYEPVEDDAPVPTPA